MTHEQARQQIEALREQIEYHNKKYYTEDAPETMRTTCCTAAWKIWKRRSRS